MNNKQEIEFLNRLLYYLKITADRIQERFVFEHRPVSLEWSDVHVVINLVNEHIKEIENEKEDVKDEK